MLYFSKTILKSLILTAAVIITAFYPPELYCSNSNEEANLTIEDFKKKAATINRKIEKQKTEIKAFTIKEKNTLIRLNDADFALSKARKSISAIKKRNS